ncbi:hypothetical protein BH09MYX1_BH09MYX1_22250 [soil metagenome]
MSVTQRLRAVGPRLAGSARRDRIDLVVSGTPHRIGALARASLRLATFRPPAEPIPLVPVPHTLSLASLDDGVELRLIGLPLVPAYAPLWPLAMAQACAVVRLDEAAAALLDETAALVGARILEAEALVAGFSEDDESMVAELLIGALT